MAYDLTGLNSTNAGTILDVFLNVNTAADYALGTGMLFLIWLFLYMAFKKEDSIADFVVSSFLTSIIAILMFLVGMISWVVLVIPIFVFAISLIIIAFL